MGIVDRKCGRKMNLKHFWVSFSLFFLPGDAFVPKPGEEKCSKNWGQNDQYWSAFLYQQQKRLKCTILTMFRYIYGFGYEIHPLFCLQYLKSAGWVCKKSSLVLSHPLCGLDSNPGLILILNLWYFGYTITRLAHTFSLAFFVIPKSQVSWIRLRDWHILSTGANTFTQVNISALDF